MTYQVKNSKKLGDHIHSPHLCFHFFCEIPSIHLMIPVKTILFLHFCHLGSPKGIWVAFFLSFSSLDAVVTRTFLGTFCLKPHLRRCGICECSVFPPTLQSDYPPVLWSNPAWSQISLFLSGNRSPSDSSGDLPIFGLSFSHFTFSSSALLI